MDKTIKPITKQIPNLNWSDIAGSKYNTDDYISIRLSFPRIEFNEGTVITFVIFNATNGETTYFRIFYPVYDI